MQRECLPCVAVIDWCREGLFAGGVFEYTFFYCGF